MMLIKPAAKYKPSEITPRGAYLNRRRFLQGAAACALSPLAANAAVGDLPPFGKGDYSIGDEHTPREKAQTHNNFYELGPQKEQPARNAGLYQSSPWRLSLEGECAKPTMLDGEDLLNLAPLEERIYRLRCVEAWSMVIPWIGYPLSALLKRAEPTANAKYVQFVTFNPEELFPDNANSSLDWPYREGLRMDEAMHPLTLLVFGMYGEAIPNQNGAPLRLIVPWKYGFKSAKAPVAVRFTAEEPETSWNLSQPREYGFYSNVNPRVSHPRWSQATEKAIGASLFPKRRDTELFNGYADEVASLYAGMDLKKFY